MMTQVTEMKPGLLEDPIPVTWDDVVYANEGRDPRVTACFHSWDERDRKCRECGLPKRTFMAEKPGAMYGRDY